MKLLGWMHRKFRQNSGEPLKDFALGHACNCLIGQPSLDDQQQYYPKPNYGNSNRQFKQVPKEHLRKSFAGLEAARTEEEEEGDYEEDSSASMSELFHGFLAIGTLGSDAVNTGPSTPTFAISVDNITEKETEVTENELKYINDELEKVLGAEARDDSCNDSSGRSSYVSAGRSSHGSTITLSGKLVEGQETNLNGTTTCPLQEYLFGSAIELSETTTVAKKENRTSLGELFQKTKIIEENSGSKCERDEKRMDKETDKSAVHLMKKILKKKMLHSSPRSSNAAGTVDSTSAEKKVHKILHMFHRKVHPETSSKKSDKPQKNMNKKNTNNGGYNNSGQMLLDEEDITILPQRVLSKRSIRRYKSQSNPPQFTLSSSDSNGSRECWIKTDADYLVLEL
ncbi:Protein LAZY 1 [Euphorbia peplus]|nr:Protein LAZY 1 [Euphorbia peplus]